MRRFILYIYYHLLLFIIIYYYLLLFIVIYHYLLLFIIIYYYLLFQTKINYGVMELAKGSLTATHVYIQHGRNSREANCMEMSSRPCQYPPMILNPNYDFISSEQLELFVNRLIPDIFNMFFNLDGIGVSRRDNADDDVGGSQKSA